jgi:predicted secreted protein
MTVKGVLASFGLLSILFALSLGAAAQASAQASASSSIGGDTPADVSVGVFVVPPGAKLALEVTRQEDCGCLCEPVLVEGWSLVGPADTSIRETTYDDPPDIADWLGQVVLVDVMGLPLPPGSVSIVVRTSIGTFRADLQIAAEPPHGAFSASASVCGLSLDVYRLVTEADAETIIDLRNGDRLMVVLQGNPTTGYEWSDAALYEYAVLREIGEPEFRPTSIETGMVGAGGFFLFRYEAIDVGPQAFRFVYARPWEATDSDRIVEFDVIVR